MRDVIDEVTRLVTSSVGIERQGNSVVMESCVCGGQEQYSVQYDLGEERGNKARKGRQSGGEAGGYNY